MATIVIATNKVPKEGMREKFIEELHGLATTHLCKLFALYGTPGPGCYNYVMDVDGLDVKGFTESAVAALFPARWAETDEKIEGFKLEGL